MDFHGGLVRLYDTLQARHRGSFTSSWTMRFLLGSDVDFAPREKMEMMPLSDAFALLSATLGVAFATMGCV